MLHGRLRRAEHDTVGRAGGFDALGDDRPQIRGAPLEHELAVQREADGTHFLAGTHRRHQPRRRVP